MLSGVCQIKGGSIKKSVLTQVAAVEVTIENALLCNVTAKSIKAAKNSVCYNVVSDGDIVLAEGEVLVGVTRPGEEQLVRFFVFKLLSYFVKNVKKKTQECDCHLNCLLKLNVFVLYKIISWSRVLSQLTAERNGRRPCLKTHTASSKSWI